MTTFQEKYAEVILGELACYDRILITGTLPDICYSEAMAKFLRKDGIRLFDYPKWAEGFRDTIRNNAEKIAQDNNLEIEFLRSSTLRKEQMIKDILSKRGEMEGLVHIFSAMERCPSFKPWYDKKSKKTFLKYTEGKCLHYYFYFIDKDMGLCYLRVPTWAPFGLQFYGNGHNVLAKSLSKNGISYTMQENSITSVKNWKTAQKLADEINPSMLRKKLDKYARLLCPPIKQFSKGYHWSLSQVEYSIDIIFSNKEILSPIYEEIIRTAVHAVKCDDIATFLGRKLTSRFSEEAGNDLKKRTEGRRIRHSFGWSSLKIYDKFGRVLRIEMTCNKVNSLRNHRRVEHRDGSWSYKLAAIPKSIYSLPDLTVIMKSACSRYISFIAAIDDPTNAIKAVEKVSSATKEGDKTYRGFNFFNSDDLNLFLAVVKGEFNISGFSNRNLRGILHGKTAAQLSRIFKRLRMHGLIKKARGRYRYYLTELGRKVIITALKIRQFVILPTLGLERI
jgi:hypothetical protein